MLPFLLLSHRPEDEAAHAEHHSFRRIMGLRSEELVQVRMNLEQPELDFADYSGIILGGGRLITRICGSRWCSGGWRRM